MMEGAAAPRDAYDKWLEDEKLLVYTGYYIEDTRSLELGDWARRECKAAFLRLSGQEGISEAHVIEIAPGQTLPPFRVGLDEVLYAVLGRGITTIWGDETTPKRTFEWQKHSMFFMPPNYTYQLTNTSGTEPARLLIMSSLPLALRMTPDPDFFFKNNYVNKEWLYGAGTGEYYSEAKAIRTTVKAAGREDTYERSIWYGSFFPDMRAWDKLDPFKGRGAGGTVVNVRFPNATTRAHMSVFPAQTYKKGHRHGPGVVIIIPAGEGYSIMWAEGQEKIVIPWHESSVFVPPNRWFHQHFNVGDTAGRYLAMHPPGQWLNSETIQNPESDQIEYPNEDPFIRNYFEEQLAKRGLKSIMPEQAYKDRNFEWDY
jgi:oxalate decarboxylase/phosphoglucose isomerase-like protein (cupin superfamily)